MQRMIRRPIEMLTLVLGCLALFTAGPASGAAAGGLSPEAEQAYQRGLIAADQQVWDVAIASFAEAQKLAPREPRFLYSLGLAHAKAGHDLAGAAWLRAYLARSPQAANAQAVGDEVARLLGASRSTMLRLFEAAAAAARVIPWQDARWNRLEMIAYDEAKVGEIEAALALEPEIAALARSIPKDRPTPEGRQPIAIRDRATIQSMIWRAYLEYLVDIRELAQAKEALGHLSGENRRVLGLISLGLGFTWDGQTETAQKLLAEAESLTAKIEDPHLQVQRLAELADAYATTHSERAKQTLEKAKALAKARQVTLPDPVEQSVDNGAYDGFTYDDEATNRARRAQQISERPEVIDLAGALDRAAHHPERTAWTNGTADEQAAALASVAMDLGDLLRIIRGDEKVHWAEDFERGKDLLALDANQPIYTCLGRSGFNDLYRLRDAHDAAWRNTPKGQAVMRGLAAVEAVNPRSRAVEDEAGWSMGIITGEAKQLAYVARQRFPDLRSLEPHVKKDVAEDLCRWLLTDPASPLREPLRAAKEAIQMP